MEMPSNQIAKPLKVYHCGQNYLITLQILILMVKYSPPLPCSMTVCDSVRSSKPLCTSHFVQVNLFLLVMFVQANLFALFLFV